MSKPFGSRGHSLEPAPRPKDVVLFFNKDNADFDWDRFPVDLLFFYQTEQWNFGGGLTYHLNPEFSGSITNGFTISTVDAKFKNSLGLVLAADFKLGNEFYLGARYTSIDYEVKSGGAGKLDGNSIGVVIGFIFGK